MKKSIFGLTAAASVLAGMLAGGAFAHAEQGQMPHMRHAMADPLGTVTLTREQARAKAVEMFARMDANSDGKLDQADRAARIAQRFDAMDANHDGALSKQEFIDAHQAMGHGPMGGPGMDGPPMEGPEPGEHGKGPHGPGEHGMAGGRHGPMGMAGMVGKADANGDHVIARDEFVAAALQRFDRADANHDSKLTAEERRAAFQAHRQAMRRGEMMPAPPPPPPPPAPANAAPAGKN